MDQGSETTGARARLPIGVARPSKVLGLGYNYATARNPDRPPAPRVVHMKPGTAIVAPGDAIVLPPESSMVVPEPELAVVIGARCRRVAPEDVDRFVLGLTCANDVTAWDLYTATGDFVASKAFDTFLPMGPGIAVGLDLDEHRAVECRVDGTVVHAAHTKAMHFGVREVVSHVSRLCTLLPGDVVSLGSPPPVGDMVALRPGATVEVEIEGVGLLRNPVAAPAGGDR